MPARPHVLLLGFTPDNRVVPEPDKSKLSKALSDAKTQVERAGYKLTILDPTVYLEAGHNRLLQVFADMAWLEWSLASAYEDFLRIHSCSRKLLKPFAVGLHRPISCSTPRLALRLMQSSVGCRVSLIIMVVGVAHATAAGA